MTRLLSCLSPSDAKWAPRTGGVQTAFPECGGTPRGAAAPMLGELPTINKHGRGSFKAWTVVQRGGGAEVASDAHTHNTEGSWSCLQAQKTTVWERRRYNSVSLAPAVKAVVKAEQTLYIRNKKFCSLDTHSKIIYHTVAIPRKSSAGPGSEFNYV